MKTFVVYSSVIVKWLHKEDEQYLDQAAKILEDVQNGIARLISPELAK